MKKRSRLFGFIATVALAATFVAPAPAAAKPAAGGFVMRNGATLNLNGQPFRFVGTNNYYLMYSSHAMVDDVLNGAAANGFTVMRTWGWLDQTPKNGYVFQTFDGTTMTYNDGPTGLGNLDYTVARAGQLGLKLVIPFTNDWSDFGGMDQYVRWVGGSYHDDFYTNATAKALYKAWISHLLNHVNSITGIAYKNDPTIMTWELANEPRCVGSGAFPASPGCSTSTITTWAAEMSAYIKSLDGKHLVSSGGEGFLCIPGATEYERDCRSGADEAAIAALPNIDVLSYHLYPDGGWNKTVAWGTQWIADHIAIAQSLSKPSMLGEFGLKNKTAREAAYQTWTDAVRKLGGNGALFWILTGVQDDGTLYPDYDGFRVTCPSSNCINLANAALALQSPGLYPKFNPIADSFSAVIDFGTTWTVNPAPSAIAYPAGGNAVIASTIDLDPATAGQQTSVTGAAGTFALQANGTVVYTPASGFSGSTSASYTISDQHGRVSNVGTLSVLVKPQPGVPIQLFSFEGSTEGWAPANWNLTAGTLATSTAWATDGSSSLAITSVDGGWFGASLSPVRDLSNGYATITVDFNVTGSGGSWSNIAIQNGAWSWCQAGGEWLAPGTVKTLTLNVLSDCGGGYDLTTIQQILVYANGNAYIDNIWAK